jgi:hypothetical protein
MEGTSWQILNANQLIKGSKKCQMSPILPTDAPAFEKIENVAFMERFPEGAIFIFP